MICLNCFNNTGISGNVCNYCGECAHLCKEKCRGLLRARAIDKKPIVYAVAKAEPLVRKFDHCRQVTCRKAFKVSHPLQVYCSNRCGRRDRNKTYREARVSAGPGPRPDRPALSEPPQPRQ